MGGIDVLTPGQGGNGSLNTLCSRDSITVVAEQGWLCVCLLI